MISTPSSERVHITFFGLRNAGKSSLVNAIAGRSVAIVSDEPGTTTDPVNRPMELGALGPVILTDTAGLDDVGELGELRVGKSIERLEWTDVALLATAMDRAPTARERETLGRLAAAGKILAVVGTFADCKAHPEKEAWLAELGAAAMASGAGNARSAATGPAGSAADGPEAGVQRAPVPAFVLRASGATGEGVAELKAALAALGFRADGRLGSRLREAGPLEGLVEAGDLVMLVTPIDSAAPRGRLILPEAETLRDCLDRGCTAVVTRELDLRRAWASLSERPRLVITDSQAFGVVAAALPPDQPLTSFSILFARKKGELAGFEAGLRRLESLAQESTCCKDVGAEAPLRLLALEACTHNRTHEDIATVKIPKLLEERTGRRVEVCVVRELSDRPVEAGFDLAVLCGACMATREKFMAQLGALASAGLPAVNFGLFLAWANGILERAVAPLGGLC